MVRTCGRLGAPLRRVFFGGVLVAAALACASPTLPLPPPSIPSVSRSTDADHVVLASACGGAEPNAIVVIQNTRPTVPGNLAVSGARATGCGSWDAIVYAHTGDYLELWQEFGTTVSTSTFVVVPSL
ncbi:MAG: hypothetical protein M3O50_05560 [Myxococcota bacterium]|nr:hypothetical protein [Myxococcota bacterium]